MEDKVMIGLVVAGLVSIWLMTQSWFWLIVGVIGGLASVFSVLASIVHFQILGALGFTILALICYGIFSVALGAGGGDTPLQCTPSSAGKRVN